MRKYLAIFAAVAVLLTGCGLPLLQGPAVGPAEQAALPVLKVDPKATDAELLANESVNFGYVIVKTVDGFDAARFERLGATVDGSFSLNGRAGTYWRLHKAAGMAKLIGSLRYTRGVQWVEPELVSHYIEPLASEATGEDYLARAFSDVLDDPAAEANEYSLAITSALDSYAAIGSGGNGYGANTVYVGIIDTGINMAHRDFWVDGNANDAFDAGESIIEYAKSAFNLDYDTGEFTFVGTGNPHVAIPEGENWDDEAHGTHTSGTIAALGNNGVATAGVAWKNVRLISYKCFAEADGSGSDWAVYFGLKDIADWRIAEDVTQVIPVNMSLGGDYAGSFELEMLNYAMSNGVLPIVAMGNEGKRWTQYPAAYAGVVSVGATNGRDELVHFSNRGHWVDVSAPGYDIISTSNGGAYWWAWLAGYTEDDDPEMYSGTQWMSGTSMATPFVTGVVGYLLSFNPSLTMDQIRTVLEVTADDLGDDGFDELFGYGRVNVLAAATMVRTGTGLPVNGAHYVTKKIVATVNNTNANYDSGMGVSFEDRVSDQTVYVYDADGQYVTLGVTNGTDGEIEFHGLVAGEYTLRTNYFGDFAEETVTLDNAADQAVAFSFDKNIVFICTVPTMAANLNAGADATDTIIDLYELIPDDPATTGVDETELVQIASYDSALLDTLTAELVSGTTYYAQITPYNDAGGNYGIYIGPSKIFETALTDGDRLADADDSHEDDDDFDLADLKGDMWDVELAANLLDGVDTFMFVVP